MSNDERELPVMPSSHEKLASLIPWPERKVVQNVVCDELAIYAQILMKKGVDPRIVLESFLEACATMTKLIK